MRKVTLVVVVGALLLVLTAGLGVARVTVQDVIFCGDQDPDTRECEGTEFSDAIFGQDTRDVIRAFSGNDNVDANEGNDEVFGGAGRDELTGGDGNDKLSGEKDRDFLNDGGFGKSKTEGPPSRNDRDELRGGSDDDFLIADDGDTLDSLFCGGGDEDFAAFDVDEEARESDFVDNSCENLSPTPVDEGSEFPPEEPMS